MAYGYGFGLTTGRLPSLVAAAIRPVLNAAPTVTGNATSGTDLVVSTNDTWTYDGLAAVPTARRYRLVVGGQVVDGPQAGATLQVPTGAVGDAIDVQMQVDVAEGGGSTSSWTSVATGTVAAAIISIADAPSTVGIGSVVDGETHAAIIARMTDPAGGDTADAGEASTSGAGTVARTITITGMSDPAVADEVGTVNVVYSATDAVDAIYNLPLATVLPAFALNQTAEQEAVVVGEDGIVTLTFTAPPEYANYDAGDGPGVFIFDEGDLDLGPINLVPRQIIDDGSADEGDTLQTYPGLWVYRVEAGGLDAEPALQWQREGTGTFDDDIAGATSGSYLITSNEAGLDIRIVETLSDNNGTRVAPSDPVSVTSSGPLLLDEFDAADGYALNDDIPATSANWQTLFATDAQIAANVSPLGIASITRSAASKNIRIAYAGAIPDDQAMEIVLENFVRNNRADPTFTLRASGTGLDETGFRMFFRTISNELYINEYSGGADLQAQIIGSITLQPGDVIRAEIIGGDAEVFINGNSVATMAGITITGGAPSWGAFLGNNASDAVNLRSVQIEDLS